MRENRWAVALLAVLLLALLGLACERRAYIVDPAVVRDSIVVHDTLHVPPGGGKHGRGRR